MAEKINNAKLDRQKERRKERDLALSALQDILASLPAT